MIVFIYIFREISYEKGNILTAVEKGCGLGGFGGMGDGGRYNRLTILTARRQGKGFAVQEKGDICLPQGDVNNIEWVCCLIGKKWVDILQYTGSNLKCYKEWKLQLIQEGVNDGCAF